MMRRIPIVATIVVLIAVATMVALGLWQLRRAQWKEGLLASYGAAQHAPPLYGVPADAAIDTLAFRRTHIICAITTAATQIGGASRAGQSGFRNIMGCRLIDGRELAVDIGWNGVGLKPPLPAIGTRIEATGPLIPDDVLSRRVIGTGGGKLPLLMVMEAPIAPLAPSVPPSIADIPNNHRSYAVQWFLFAGVAIVIFVLAALRREKAR